MQCFYRHLAEAQDKGTALRQAKIDLISEFADQAVPFYLLGGVHIDRRRGESRFLASARGLCGTYSA